MTIQKAINSGKPFKRSAWHEFPKNYWIDNYRNTLIVISISSETNYERVIDTCDIDLNSILATDWETKK